MPHCRNLEMVLFGCQSSLCVVVELGEELPSPADIQLAHGRLRSLCLGGGGNAWTLTHTDAYMHAERAAAHLRKHCTSSEIRNKNLIQRLL